VLACAARLVVAAAAYTMLECLHPAAAMRCPPAAAASTPVLAILHCKAILNAAVCAFPATLLAARCAINIAAEASFSAAAAGCSILQGPHPGGSQRLPAVAITQLQSGPVQLTWLGTPRAVALAPAWWLHRPVLLPCDQQNSSSPACHCQDALLAAQSCLS
jgi:hypothetical protein